jgi:hypothetical protein
MLIQAGFVEGIHLASRAGRVVPNVSNAFERAGFISLKFSVLWILV